eukprot:GFKZ01005912.1.p2 GENE.GFKZ01005912.1~~GFKZ01005912.1.p2  ORF type:complete len:105 (+),score=17.82 GFKZ01005912.1:1103-1417(+)
MPAEKSKLTVGMHIEELGQHVQAFSVRVSVPCGAEEHAEERVEEAVSTKGSGGIEAIDGTEDLGHGEAGGHLQAGAGLGDEGAEGTGCSERRRRRLSLLDVTGG